jgi:hypothetical protein
VRSRRNTLAQIALGRRVDEKWPRMEPSHRSTRTRAWVETAVAGVTGALFLLTLVRRDWLEAFGFDPDGHDGTVEWLIVAGLFALFVTFTVAARLEWRRQAFAR